MQTGVQIAGSASSSPILQKGVVAVPEPLTCEILTQTVLQLQDGGLPTLNHQDEWRVTPEVLGAMERLMTIIAWVRSPSGGWPSDREVTPENLLPYVMDEALDVLECLEKSWGHLGFPPSHPFAPLQKLLSDRVILSDAIAQLLWGVARSSIDIMQLLGGMSAELFQAGKDWTPGILRLMAVLTIQTPNFQWQMDLVTAAPPLPELHPDSFVRWSGSTVFWAEGLLQNLHRTIAENTLPLYNLLTQTVSSDIIAPSQSWQKGTLHLSLGFTFAPHATKPVLTVLPATLAFAEPPKPDQDWDVSSFLSLTVEPQPGIASVPPLSAPIVPPAESDRSIENQSASTLEPSKPALADEPLPVETMDPSPAKGEHEQTETLYTEALFDEVWVSGWGAPAPDLTEGKEHLGESGLAVEFLEPETLGKETLGEDVSNPALVHEEQQDLFEGWEEEPQVETDRPHAPQRSVPSRSATADLLNGGELGESETSDIEPDFEIILEGDASVPIPPRDPISAVEPSLARTNSASNSASKPTSNSAEVVVDEAENWDLEQWHLRWFSEKTGLESDRLQLPRTYHVRSLLNHLGNQGKVAQPSPNKEHHLLEIIEVACQAFTLPDPPPTLLNTDFVVPESSLAALVHRLTWQLIRHSYGLTCLLSGITAEILQPEWGWEVGILRLLPILKIQGSNLSDGTPVEWREAKWGEGEDLDLQIDLSTGAPAPLETILVLPDILVNIDGVEWQKTRESAAEFRAGLLQQIYQLLPELEVLGCPVPVEVSRTGEWQPATVQLQFELGFQTDSRSA